MIHWEWVGVQVSHTVSSVSHSMDTVVINDSNESLITTVSIEWDTEDTVWETCTPTHSQWIIDHNSIHWMGYRRHRVGDLYWGTSLPHRVFCIPFNGDCWDQWFIESGLRYKSPTPCLLYPIRRHGVGDLYLNPLSMNHWSQQYPLNGIQKTWCGRLVPQPTLNESLITTVSIEWDTEDTVDTVVINDSLRVGWGTNLPHHVFCIPFNGYCCDQWFIESGLPLNGIQKTRCGRFVPQPTLNESLITTVSIEWDTEDMVWEICTSTHSQWIIDHNRFLLYPIQWILLWSMIHWEWVGVQVSHTMSSVSHSIDTVVINDSLRVGW
jgi:hypothetical protein